MSEPHFVVSSVHDIGITVLYEPPKPVEPVVDMVFIHGLQGHPRNTWTWESKSGPQTNSTPIERKPKENRLKSLLKRPKKEDDLLKLTNPNERSVVFWPYHLLPEACPQSRILTWGYNSLVSTFFHGSASKNTIFSYSRDLLGDLNRERTQCQNRPLIIVAHSLGGIIAKQMALHANESTLERDQHLGNSIRGFLFLGTPHQGSPMADLGETMTRIVSVVGVDVAQQNLKTLKVDCDSLRECQRRFSLLLKRRGEIDICIFQEAKGVKGISYIGLNDKVVPDLSSSMEGAESIFTVNANHMDMCRYSDKTSDGYRKVSGELQRLCDSVRRAEQIRSEEEKVAEQLQKAHSCLDSLAYREMNYRQQEVQDAGPDSSTWIFHHESYKKWLDEGCGLLWVKGKPGSGKSTLMKKIFKSINEHKPSTCVRLAYFFHKRGSSLQQTPVGMFRTILHQLLSQVPLVGGDFQQLWEQKKKWETGREQDWEWRIEELREVFSSTLLAAAKSHTITVFIDALDEAGDVSSKETVHYFYKLNERLSQFKAATSICFSCRHFPIFVVRNAFEVCVENENQADIERYVCAELEGSLDTDELEAKSNKPANTLQNLISNKASGVFLWAVLVVPMIITQYNNGEPLDTILDTLAQVPSDLGETYKHIVTKVLDPKSKPRTLRLLQWIYLAKRPLSVTEIRFAMASDDSSVHPALNSCCEAKGFIENDEKMKRQIITLSGGLAEVHYHNRHPTVQFIHQSVNDFLFKEGFMFLDPSLQDPVGKGHRQISTACLNYIKFNDLLSCKQLKEVPSIGYKKSAYMQSAFPFVDYATTYLFQHLAEAEGLGIPNEDLLRRFEWPEQRILHCWKNLLKIVLGTFGREKSKILRIKADDMTLLHVAAAWDLDSIVKALLQNGVPIEEVDQDRNTALHHAAIWGNEQIIQRLLAENAELDAKNQQNETALYQAAENGHEAAMKLLINRGADIENRSNKSESALNAACLHGNYREVLVLLDVGANVNAQGGTYGNALQAASYCGFEAIVSALLQKGANVNAQGGTYGNALQAASLSHNLFIVKLLLENGAEVNAQGGCCENALLAAISHDNEAVVSALLQKGANVNAQGGTYGNALQAASWVNNLSIVKLLLKNGAEVNAQGGNYGNALQAASSRNNLSLVKLLLENGAEVNAQGGNYGNALQAASSGNNLSLVKLLLENGAEVNAQGGCCENALLTAINHGNEAIVSTLLQKKADANASSKYYGNVLQAASRGNDPSIVKLLLENGAEVNARGGRFGSALNVALYMNHRPTIDLLLKHGAIDTRSKKEENEIDSEQ